MSEEKIQIPLGRDEALILFELLADFQAQSCLRISSPAERLALTRLQGALEKLLVEPLMPEYRLLIDEARSHLSAEFGT